MTLLQSPVRTIVSGAQAVAAAGTAEALVSADTPCAWVLVGPEPTNTGVMYVGDADVSSSTGLVLAQTDEPIRLDVDNVNKVFVDAATSADEVRFLYGAE